VAAGAAIRPIAVTPATAVVLKAWFIIIPLVVTVGNPPTVYCQSGEPYAKVQLVPEVSIG